MWRGGLNDPEKDPSLLPESRVRPWVLDDTTERQVRNSREELERTSTFVSPVKDGLGSSSLDCILSDDRRGGMFFQELGRLQLESDATEARKRSGAGACPPIGEVFEDLYRETHGLPPRRKRVTETDNSGERHSGIELTVEADKEERRACSEGKSSGGLEADPDIARLIALLQERELELDTSNSSVGDAGSGVGSQEDGGTGDGTEKAEGEMDEQATGGDQLDMGGGEGIDIYGGGRWRRGRSNVSGQGHDDAAKSVPTERAGDTRQNERLLCGGREGSAGERERDNSVENLSPEQQQKCRQQLGRIDISRTKIDGTERGAAAGPRPSSAPSAFLSAGGFSRLSRTPSSHFARTVGQKLLHAEKVLAERLLVDAQEEALMKPSLAIAEARVKIDVVRQSADALQASKSIKRKSYLRGSRPCPAKWFPRDADVRNLAPRDPLEDGSSVARPEKSLSSTKCKLAGSANMKRQQRPQTAGCQRRKGPPLAVLGGSTSTPLLTRTERDFVFGPTSPSGPLRAAARAAALGATDEDEAASFRHPSARQTTLGRMLRRAASAAASETTATTITLLGRLQQKRQSWQQQQETPCRDNDDGNSRLLSPSSSSSAIVGGRTADNSSYNNVGRYAAEIKKLSGSRTVKTRPPSAAPGSHRNRLSSTKDLASSSVPAEESPCVNIAGGGVHEVGSQSWETSDASCGKGGVDIVLREKGPCLVVTSARRAFDVEMLAPGSGRPKGDLGVERGDKSRGVDVRGVGADKSGQEMNVRQALKAAINSATGSVTPRGQFASARKLIAELKQINMKDSTRDVLLTTQVRDMADILNGTIAEQCRT